MTATRWTLPGLLAHLDFVHTNMPDHAYAWVLGAGASLSSGIPLAGDLVRRWLSELHRRLDREGKPLADWATEKNLGIAKFDYKAAPTFYSRVYERRFGGNPDEGFAYLEALMTGKDPSPGYSILAQILDKTQHKVVISTNFDNLVADALSIYTTAFPLVIGHESLASFVRVTSRRPIICKIHRDLLLGPKNDHRSLRRLHESWAAALRALFSQYTPIFIGYGGNDDSLMDLLESLDLEDIKGQLIWCYHQHFEPSERIIELVKQHNGALVPVPDFDLLMVQIGDKMKIQPIDDAIEQRAAERARKYREQLINLDTTPYPEARRILRGAFERAGGTLVWMQKINSEASTMQRKQLYEHALEQYPTDLELQLNHAAFLQGHNLELNQCRTKLQQLRAHDSELRYGPSYYLALMCCLSGLFDEAKELLSDLPASPRVNGLSASLAEFCGDITTAESLRRLGDDGSLFLFLMRQKRFAESILILEQHQGDRDWAVYGAFVQWHVHKDVVGGLRLLEDQIDAESANHKQAEALALFALLNDDLQGCEVAISQLRSRPASGWVAETHVAILGLFYSLRKEGVVDEDRLELVRQLFARGSYVYLSSFRNLQALAEALSPKLPKTHRKFVIDVAKACYDPALRAGLNVYDQWRGA